jgi:hypothetical protein
MTNHPGKPITIYEIASLVGSSLPLAFTPSNILAGFRASGISPFNRDIFNDEDFLPSSVTDRELPAGAASSSTVDLQSVAAAEQPSLADGPAVRHRPNSDTLPASTASPITEHNYAVASSRKSPGIEEPAGIPTGIVSPEAIKPYPKAAPRKTVQRKNKATTRILTDTPVKERLEREEEMKNKKKSTAKECKKGKTPAAKRRLGLLPDASVKSIESAGTSAKKPRPSRNANASNTQQCPCTVCSAIYGSEEDVKVLKIGSCAGGAPNGLTSRAAMWTLGTLSV